MKFHYDVKKIRELLSAVSLLTGISMAFLDSDGVFLCKVTTENDYCSHIQKEPRNCEKCHCSDKELLDHSWVSGKYESHICYAGLYDAAIPLVKDGARAGSVIMGRVRTTYAKPDRMLDQGGALADLYDKIPVFTDDQLKSLRILLPNILFESAVCIEHDSVINDVVDYIQTNFRKPITVATLCKKYHISKNFLYQQFHKELNTTVNDYIVNCRLRYAKELLTSTNYSVSFIAEESGFGSNTYFNRIFKNKTGLTPLYYRRSNGK